MQLNNIQAFLGLFDVKTLGVAVAVCTVMAVLKKVLKDKLKKSVSVYLPTVLATVFQFALKLALYGTEFAFSSETLYEGLVTGSVSTVLSVAVNKLIAGKSVGSPAVMIIESILSEIVKKENMQSVTEEILIITEQDFTKEQKTQMVSEIIFNYTNLEMDDEQRETLSMFILNSVSAIKK